MRLQDLGITAVLIPSEPYEYWDEEKREGKGILSLKHAGYLAGIGVLGKNTLLLNDSLGNMITLGAVLVNTELEGDTIAQYKICSEKCQLCIESCPAKALDGTKVEQKLCREKSNLVTKKGYALYTCNICRRVCPKGRGTKNR
jgi:epoxyqueuosine reductase